jgi:uncharacterized protein YkwD
MTHRRRIAVAVALAALALLVVCAPAGAQSKRLSSAEWQVVRLVNQARVSHGKASLRISYALSRAAERHSRDMLRAGTFTHSVLAGGTPSSRARLSGYPTAATRAWSVGEVIGWGAGSCGSPETMVKMWLGSPTHRSILLSSRWRHIGVGRVTGSFQGCSGAAVYTVDFGFRR